MGIHPKWVQTAEQTNTWVFPAGLNNTYFPLSKIVSVGYSFSCFTYYAVSLLIKTGVPFQTTCNTYPGGSEEISTSI
jgi:hypothetical protein